MVKRRKIWFLIIVLAVALTAGCGKRSTSARVGDRTLPDGSYTVDVTLEGGSGRADIASPARLQIERGQITAEIVWSSSGYDYMVVDGEKYFPENEEGNSSFQIPVTAFDCDLEVTADTTAMSKPHEIEYTLYFDSASVKEERNSAGRNTDSGTAPGSVKKDTSEARADITEIPEIEGLVYKETAEIDSASCFQIYRYEDGYSVIRVDDGNNYLLVPENGKVPEGLPGSYTVLQKPLDHIYLAASAVMSLFDSAGALENVRLSGLREDAWYIEHAKKAMEEGKILFAGKYSEPDYELLLAQDCDLAVESTMILHSPDVQEKLETLGIPVLIDRSSYEPEPLGRTEWIKLYGELTDKASEAQRYFEKQKEYVEELSDFENTEKTVAFFYINDSGMIVTRKSSDYLPKMIEKAGGRYIPDVPGDDGNASSGVTMSMEEFYASAADADYLIYNATIENPMESVDELLEKSGLFADFKAVKEGNVWCTGKYLYQATNVTGSMVRDLHTMLTDEDAKELSFMTRLKEQDMKK